MKQLIYISLFAGLLGVSACSNETEDSSGVGKEKEICFSATLQESQKVESRAIGAGENGGVVVLPQLSGIYIRKVQPSETVTTSPYHVASANKGVLEFKDEKTNILKWNKYHLGEPVDFYAWTVPVGVTISDAATTGTIDFVGGNTFPMASNNDADKLNNTVVTPLEQFVTAQALDNLYANSPSVTLPFKHQVCKVSISLRDWDAKHIDKSAVNINSASIKFLFIPPKWTITQTESDTKSPFVVTKATDSDDLSLEFKNLQYTDGYFTMYLPPLIEALGTDFTEAGEFCITYEGKEYYGTLSNITLNGGKELNAGEHMAIAMDLSKNYGVGVGATILDWKGPDKEDIIEANPQRGIYSEEGLRVFMEAVNNGTAIPDSINSGEDGAIVVKLYKDIKISSDPWTAIGTADKSFTGTFDGNGYTISGITGTGLFGVVKGSVGASATIQNLYLSGSVSAGVSASAGLLTGSAEYADIKNCHVIDIKDAAGTVISSSSVSVTDASGYGGGLIGSVSGTGGITLANCSVETTGTFSVGSGAAGATLGALVGTVGGIGTSIANCFAVFNGAAGIGLIGSVGSSTIAYSYYWNKQEDFPSTGFWSATGETGTISFDMTNVFETTVTITSSNSKSFLLDALNGSAGGKGWVYIYGKDYPVLKIE